jgi:hypothetical protein
MSNPEIWYMDDCSNLRIPDIAMNIKKIQPYPGKLIFCKEPPINSGILR